MTPTDDHASDPAHPDEFGDTAPGAAPPEPPACSPPLPKVIGRYSVKRVIASGGMGTVYEAIQEQPRRRVALKVMRHGLASRSLLRRFEFESQILSRLRHPHVAQVYEAGTHDDGAGSVPYFAMEYVPNARTLIEYANERKVDNRERLALFAKVCHAVHHGHQKGIIHRDLKPDNILVDSSGEPKVIDFGVARATDSDMAITTLQTDVGQLIGTLQYMSPEQCDADPTDLDTRTDVYALGVVLYELLCGALPYDLSTVAIHEAARVIRESTPTRPRTVNSVLSGDLETITLKALEKDRERRYQAAADLERDLHHFLADEPIEARRPSLSYQVQSFARRNRALLVGTGAVLIALTVGLIIATIGFVQARAERDRAQGAEQEAIAQRDTAEAVTEFLASMLSAPRPGVEGRDVLVRDVLDDASSSIAEDLADQPLVEARLRHTLGETYFTLGLYDEAERHLLRARAIRQAEFGDEHPDTLASTHNLATLYLRQRRLDEAEPLLESTYEIRTRIIGKEHLKTLGSMNNLAALYVRQGRLEEAQQLYVETLEIQERVLGEEHPNRLTTMGNLASLYQHMGRFDEAEPLYVTALDIQERVRGEEHPDTIRTMNNLALLYIRQKRLDAAEPLYVKTLEIKRRVLGDEHNETLDAMNNLAWLLKDRGPEGLDAAFALAREAAGTYRRLSGVDHASTINAADSFAIIMCMQERYTEAVPLINEIAERSRKKFGEDQWFTVVSGRDHARCLIKAGEFLDARFMLLTAYHGMIETRPETVQAEVIPTIIELYEAWEKPEQVQEWRGRLDDR